MANKTPPANSPPPTFPPPTLPHAPRLIPHYSHGPTFSIRFSKRQLGPIINFL